MNNSLHDEQLYINFLHGETEALDELLIRHKDGLIWFLYGIVKNMEDAEDIMMDTFATIIIKRPQFNKNSTFKTWLYGIGRNLARSHIRKHKIANEAVEEITPDIYKDMIERSNMLTEIIKEEDIGQMYKAFDGLTKDYKSVLYLLYIEQLSVDQVAKIMKKTAKQIYNLNARAKIQMKKEMETIKGKD